MDNMNTANFDKKEAHDKQRCVEQLRAVFDEIEAAAYTGISISSLRKGRMNGKRDNYVVPPPYLKLGRRVGYLKVDLDAWLLAHRVEV